MSQTNGRAKHASFVGDYPVNGTPAATAATVAQVEGDRRTHASLPSKDEGSVYRLLFVSHTFKPATLMRLRRTAYSFRNLSESEAEAIKPLRLRIVKAQSQSVNELSSDCRGKLIRSGSGH